MKILGYSYTLQSVDGDLINTPAKTKIDKQIIYISKDQCDEQKISSVLHEIIEALDYALEFETPHRCIVGLEAGLYQALIDNGVDLSPLIKEL